MFLKSKRRFEGRDRRSKTAKHLRRCNTYSRIRAASELRFNPDFMKSNSEGLVMRPPTSPKLRHSAPMSSETSSRASASGRLMHGRSFYMSWTPLVFVGNLVSLACRSQSDQRTGRLTEILLSSLGAFTEVVEPEPCKSLVMMGVPNC